MGLFDFLKGGKQRGQAQRDERASGKAHHEIEGSLVSSAESEVTYEYLAKRDTDDNRLAQSQLLRRLVRLKNMEQVSMLLGLWRKEYDLYEPMLEPAPSEMAADELAKRVRAQMAL